MQATELAKLITDTLDDNKAKDIVGLDVSELTTVTDYMVICTATSSRQMNALLEKVARACRDHDIRPLNSIDPNADDWQLLDFGDVIVHIMLAESREFYQLEKLWDKTQTLRDEN